MTAVNRRNRSAIHGLVALTAVLVVALAARAILASGPIKAQHITLTVNEGRSYHRSAWLGIVPVKVIPQMAMWLEDDAGRFVDTIYVTKKAATAGWGEKVQRPAALPIWSHRRGVRYPNGSYMPTKDQPLPDAVTGATPQDSFAKKWAVPAGLVPGTYVVRVEVNNSFDYDAVFRKDLPPSHPDYNTDYSGQPSLLWEGRVQLGTGLNTVRLFKTGYGHPAGKTGEIFTDLGKLSDALDIIQSITVDVD